VDADLLWRVTVLRRRLQIHERGPEPSCKTAPDPWNLEGASSYLFFETTVVLGCAFAYPGVTYLPVFALRAVELFELPPLPLAISASPSGGR
jgi:hypothetical protein